MTQPSHLSLGIIPLPVKPWVDPDMRTIEHEAKWNGIDARVTFHVWGKWDHYEIANLELLKRGNTTHEVDLQYVTDREIEDWIEEIHRGGC